MSAEMVKLAIAKGAVIGLGKTFVRGHKLYCYVYVKTGLYGKKTKYLLPAAIAFGLKRLFQGKYA
jgi:hypothetical protein